MIDLSAYQAAFASLPQEITHAEINAEKVDQTSIEVKGGQIAGSESYVRTKLYVRAGGERTGMVYTEKTDEDAMTVICRAAANAAYSTEEKPEPMNGAFVYTQQERPDGGDSVEALLAFGCAAENEAACINGVTIHRLCVGYRLRELRTVNHLGLDVSTQSYYVFASIHLSTPRENGASDGMAQVTARTLEELNAEELMRRALNDSFLQDGDGLPAYALPSGKYRAVVSGQMMRNILMTAWVSFSGAAIQSGASSIKSPGERVGSECFHVINAPGHPAVGQHFIADSEGTLCREETLVQNGVFVSPLLTLASAPKEGRSSTASAGRVARMTGDVPIALTTVPNLLYIQAGESTQDELLQRMETGLYLTYSLDLYHSVDVAAGRFSVPCGGIYYENGKPVGSLSQITVSGSLKELWQSIRLVASDLAFDDFYFITYCVGSPSVLVDEITVAG